MSGTITSTTWGWWRTLDKTKANDMDTSQWTTWGTTREAADSLKMTEMETLSTTTARKCFIKQRKSCLLFGCFLRTGATSEWPCKDPTQLACCAILAAAAFLKYSAVFRHVDHMFGAGVEYHDQVSESRRGRLNAEPQERAPQERRDFEAPPKTQPKEVDRCIQRENENNLGGATQYGDRDVHRAHRPGKKIFPQSA